MRGSASSHTMVSSSEICHSYSIFGEGYLSDGPPESHICCAPEQEGKYAVALSQRGLIKRFEVEVDKGG